MLLYFHIKVLNEKNRKKPFPAFPSFTEQDFCVGGMPDYDIITLPNGIRILHKQVSHTKVVHCGFILDIGSRDEKPEQMGIAHFWEHMAFKGTRKRKSYHILNRLDSVGGELNAYTTKEKICFFASVLDQHFDNAVELLSDITFHSVFPEKQIEKERGVILEEMSMYYDAPEDAIQDEFDAVVFGNHPLGRNILGTSDTIKRLNRSDFHHFVKENMNTGRLIFSCVGNIPLRKVKKLAEKYFGDVEPRLNRRERQLFNTSMYRPELQTVQRSLTQSQCAIGRSTYSSKDDRYLPFFLLANLLGGPGMNSRLNMSLREKYGFVYAIDAGYQAYTDTGLFAIYFGTEPSQMERSIKLVLKELKKLQDQPLGTLQLHKAKMQLMGQLAMGSENNQNLMLGMARSLLDLGEVESLESVFESIKKITAYDLQEIARDMFREEELSILRYVPQE